MADLSKYPAKEIEGLLSFTRRKHPDRYRQFLEIAYADPVVGRRLLDRTVKSQDQPVSARLLVSLQGLCRLREQEN